MTLRTGIKDKDETFRDSGRPLSSHEQIPGLFQTLQVNIYGVLTLATAAIQNEMHVISHCNAHTFSHNYDNCVLNTNLT